MPLTNAEINRLAREIRRIVCRPIAWIASNVADFGADYHLLGVSRWQYIRRETVGCARQIAEWLKEDPEVRRLLREPNSQLRPWLYEQVLGTHPRKANGFRGGMLFKILAGPQDEVLHAGFVLTCKWRGCQGEIQFDDHCSRCGHLWCKPVAPDVDPAKPCPAKLWHEPAFRLYFGGQREPASCKRCLFCGGLFFQYAGLDPTAPPDCPGCHKTLWSRGPTRVLVRRRMIRAVHPAEGGRAPRLKHQADGGIDAADIDDIIAKILSSDDARQLIDARSRGLPEGLRGLLRSLPKRLSPADSERVIETIRRSYLDFD